MKKCFSSFKILKFDFSPFNLFFFCLLSLTCFPTSPIFILLSLFPFLYSFSLFSLSLCSFSSLFALTCCQIFFLFSLSKWNHDSVVQFCITKSQFCCVAQLLHNRIVICCVICYTTQWNRITLSFYIF